jgi:hypothetical protein
MKTTKTDAVEELAQEPAHPPQKAGAASDAKLPHDRDESSTPPKEDAQHRHNREPIAQAHRDVEAGVKDTERIGTPNDVPSSRKNAGPGR